MSSSETSFVTVDEWEDVGEAASETSNNVLEVMDEVEEDESSKAYGQKYSEAQAMFLAGDFKGAMTHIVTVLDIERCELMDDRLFYKRFLACGHNHRMLYRNNLGILRTAVLGFIRGESLFRIGLEDAIEFTEGPLLELAPLPLYIMDMMKIEMEVVIYNLGLSWLMNPVHGWASFSAISYTLTRIPKDPRLWLHAAEACISFECSKTASIDAMFSPLPQGGDVFRSAISFSKMLGDDLHLISTYIRNMGNKNDASPSFKYAQKCLLLSSQLVKSYAAGDSETLISTTDALDVISIKRAILINRCYIALRLKNYDLCMKYAQKILKSKRSTKLDKMLARCYQDLIKFILGEADWKIFKRVSLDKDESVNETPEALEIARKQLAPMNASRRYHNTLGSILNPMNINSTVGRLEEYVKDKQDQTPLALLTLYMFLAYKSIPPDSQTATRRKLNNLHRLLIRLSPIYLLEFCKKMSGETVYPARWDLGPTTQGIEKVTWEILDGVEAGKAEPKDVVVATGDPVTTHKPMVLIKVSQKGFKSVRIPY